MKINQCLHKYAHSFDHMKMVHIPCGFSMKHVATGKWNRIVNLVFVTTKQNKNEHQTHQHERMALSNCITPSKLVSVTSFQVSSSCRIQLENREHLELLHVTS